MLSDLEKDFWSPFVFVFGAICGSFLNVCIYRLPRRQSIILPPSRCMSCRTKIRFYDNIPIIGYLLCQGRCRYCGKPFSIRYAFVELLTAVLVTSLFCAYGITTQSVFFFLFFSVLIVVSFIDIDHRIIPNSISIPGIFLGFLAAVIMPLFVDDWFVTPKESLLGLVLGGGSLFFVNYAYSWFTGRDGIGFGDVKLLAMMGAFFGAAVVLWTIFLGSLMGSIYGVGMIVLQRRSSKYPMPFGPFIVLGCVVSLLFAEQLAQWFATFSLSSLF